ncbi:HET-domain-containing protein [Xylariaceae sp. FL0594]|nr:HET-domain-containing protein [Xylariaceae sp. FL0594]
MGMGQLYDAPLATGRREIRLLELLSYKEQITCRLYKATISDDLKFTALSYTWGDPHDTTPIVVNGVETAVTKNLAIALRYVHSSWEHEFPGQSSASLRLWVDALCINQADSVERGEQVRLMPDIFSSAELVLGWLGHQEPEKLVLAAETIDKLADAIPPVPGAEWEMCDMDWIAKSPDLIVAPECDSRWQAIYHLCSLPYWTRVWVLQENVLADQILYASPKVVTKQPKLRGVCLFLKRLSWVLREHEAPQPGFLSNETWMFFNPPSFTSSPTWEPICKVLSAKYLRQGGFSDAMITHPGYKERRYNPDLSMSEMGAVLQATDPKDHVYGLLGITSLQVEVDYSDAKSLKDVYLDYCEAAMVAVDRKGNLDLFFLRHAGIGVFQQNEAGLPSWVPNYPESARLGATAPRLQFDQDQSLSPHLPPVIPGPWISQRRHLHIVGATLSSVGRLAPKPPTLENLRLGDFREWWQDYLRRYPAYPLDSIPSLRALFITVMSLPSLVFDMPTFHMLERFAFDLGIETPEIGKPPARPAYPPEPKLSEHSWQLTDDIEQTPYIIYLAPPSLYRARERSLPPEQISDQARYRLSKTLERNAQTALFEVEGGYLGLGPRGSAEGDIVCMIDGFNDLVLLRPQPEMGYPYFHYVGPCSIPGLTVGKQ